MYGGPLGSPTKLLKFTGHFMHLFSSILTDVAQHFLIDIAQGRDSITAVLLSASLVQRRQANGMWKHKHYVPGQS